MMPKTKYIVTAALLSGAAGVIVSTFLPLSNLVTLPILGVLGLIYWIILMRKIQGKVKTVLSSTLMGFMVFFFAFLVVGLVKSDMITMLTATSAKGVEIALVGGALFFPLMYWLEKQRR